MEFEKLFSFNCCLKIYTERVNMPKEHNCQFALGSIDAQPCFQVVNQGIGARPKIMKFSSKNINSMSSHRIDDGNLTVNLQDSEWQMVVIKQAKDKTALKDMFELLEKIHAGEFPSGSTAGTPNRSYIQSSGGRMMDHSSLNTSGGRKTNLSYLSSKAPTNYRGLLMLSAAQSAKTGKQTGSFYNSSTPKMEPFLPGSHLQQSKVVSPSSIKSGGNYFKTSTVRRNLSIDLDHQIADENDIDDFQTSKSFRPSPMATTTPSRTPLTDLLSQPPTAALQYPARSPEDLEGFANLGNTCYMNAVLQSLLGLEPFAEDLLRHQLVKAVHPHSLYRMLFLLLKSKRAKDTYDSQRILLKKIKGAISARTSKFIGYRQQDAHELLSQCLDQLQDDLNQLSRSSADSQDGPLSPVVRNFECDIKHTITCKGCGKVTTNTEKIYDFALQLPKSVLLRPNEQANLQQLFDLYFSSEEVEYTCTACSCKSATLSHQLARLPRVLVLFLKRYGYNSQLSKNSKRVDNIRIPRIINIKHLCVNGADPPCEFKGPWPTDPGALSALATSTEDKENVPRIDHHHHHHHHMSPQQNSPPLPTPVLGSSGGDNSDIIITSSAPLSSDNNLLLNSSTAGGTCLSLQRSQQQQQPPLGHHQTTPSPVLTPNEADSHRHDGAQSSVISASSLPPPPPLSSSLTTASANQTVEATREGACTYSTVAPPTTTMTGQHSSLIYDTEAPLAPKRSEGQTEGEVFSSCGSGVLGKRKSSERDSHSSDDGYCTCGSCDSTPRGSASTVNCVCRNKVKRKDHQTKEYLLSSEEPPSCCVPRGGRSYDTSDDRRGSCTAGGHVIPRGKEEVHVRTQTEMDGSDANVNGILDEFDSIFESPDAVAALKINEKVGEKEEDDKKTMSTMVKGLPRSLPLPSPPTTPLLVSDGQTAPRPTTPPPPLGNEPQVQSITEGQKPLTDNIELSIGLEEIAKREDEELKKAVEESLKQQPNDFQLLHQLGMSEEEQLKLALELSIQESLPEESLLPPSSPCSLTPTNVTPVKDGVEQNNRTVSPEPGNLEVYRLVSVVSHIGKGSSGGHYISDVYSVGSREWKTYNDSQVADTREEDVRQRRQCTGYIFFYMHRSTFNSVAKLHKH